MKLSTRDAGAYFSRPDPGKAGILIYGADAMRVALKRQELIAALLGPGAEEEMRLSRMSGADLRGDPALLLDAVKATGFFPGARAVLVEEAGDAVAETVAAALADWRAGDAQIVVTAGALKASSALRKGFEAARDAYAVGLYDEPPGRDEIVRMLAAAGLSGLPRDALGALEALSRALGPGDLAQTVGKLALYKLGDDTPVTPEDIEAVAPRSTEAALDDIANAVAEARAGEVGPVLRRLQAQGTTAVALVIAATRHFRTLYTAAAHPGGAQEGVARLRPPVYGARRDRLLRQAQGWNARNLQAALELLTDTDLALRSAGQSAPQMALVERAMIRLAMMRDARI